MPAARKLLAAQGAYYAATGIWSLVSIGSFQKVTGPKTDLWLVKTVGTLVTTIGGALMLASRRPEEPTPQTMALAAGSAAGLATIDAVYVAKRRISPIYLLDALAEAGILGMLALAGPTARASSLRAP